MQEASVTRFKRFDGTGESVEYRTKDRGYLLAYIDYSGDGTGAACTVYSPSTSRGHYYAERPAKKAEAIVERHLNTEGYTGEGTGMRDMQPGDKVTSTKWPGVWEVVKVGELVVTVTLNGHTHTRPKDWFTLTESSTGGGE